MKSLQNAKNRDAQFSDRTKCGPEKEANGSTCRTWQTAEPHILSPAHRCSGWGERSMKLLVVPKWQFQREQGELLATGGRAVGTNRTWCFRVEVHCMVD